MHGCMLGSTKATLVMLLPTDLNFCKAGESFNSDATIAVSNTTSCRSASNQLLSWTNKASWSDVTCNDINTATRTEVNEHGREETSRLSDIMAHDGYVGGCCGNRAWTNVMCAPSTQGATQITASACLDPLPVGLMQLTEM